MKLFELYAELGLDSSGFDKGIKKASKAGGGLASTLRSGLGGASNYVGKQISATTVMLGNLMADAARKGAELVKNTASAGIKYNASMETYVTNFKTMLGGSSEAAQQLTSDLEDMAASTPFAMSDLAGATNTLLAFGQSSDTVLDTLKSLGDISMGDANKLQSLTLAFAQASSSGKLMGQDLMQMINAGFNPLQTIVEKTGASMGDLKEFMSTGKASKELKKQMQAARKEVKALGDNASDGAKMLVQMYEDGAISADLLGQVFDIETSPGGRFYNAMKAASETFDGLMSTLEDDSNALLGKVFKPLSDWMTTDLLPNAIGAIGEISAAFDQGGLEAAVNKAVEIAGGYLDSLGAKALETGSGMLANVLTGLTGDTVTGPEITAFFTGIWNDASGAADTFIAGAGGVLKGIWDGITGDAGNKTNIISELDGIWTSASASLSTFTSAAGGLLGTIYEQITGQEATATNIGNTIGGVFKAGGTAITDVLTTASTFFTDLSEELGDPDTALLGKVEGVFTAGADAMSNLLEDAGSFMTNLYAAITGDEEGAAKIQAWIDDLFTTSEERKQQKQEALAPTVASYEERQTEEEEQRSAHKYAGAFAGLNEDTRDVLWDYAVASLEAGGQSNVKAGLWTDELNLADGETFQAWQGLQGMLSEMTDSLLQLDPAKMYEAIDSWFEGEDTSASKYWKGDEGQGDGDLASAVSELTAAASTLAGDAASAAAGALNGAKVEMDGAAVGRIVLPYVSQSLARGAKVMQKAHP